MPTRLQGYTYIQAFEHGPLNAEQRREARRRAGYGPTGGWYRGALAHLLEWTDERKLLTRLRPEGHEYLATCRAEGYGQ